MENKDWENFLNDLNGDLHPRENQSQGEDSPGHFDGQQLNTPPDDELLKEMLNGYSPQASVEGWEKIAASLDAADEIFDHQVRHRIHQYHAAYDPQSWTKFAKRFSAQRHLRTRLIVVKLSEAAAILLLILTVLHISQKGRVPVHVPMAEGSGSYYDQEQHSLTRQSTESDITDIHLKVSANNSFQARSNTPVGRETKSSKDNLIAASSQEAQTHPTSINTDPTFNNVAIVGDPIFITSESQEITSFPLDQPDAATVDESTSADHGNIPIVNFLEQPVASIQYVNQSPIQKPTLVASRCKKYIEFGMLAQADYNQLKMPEDRLNSNGEQIIFPLEGITSPGFGAGITLAIGHPRWAVETGVIYNTKSFRPSRELTIGNEADNSKVEYDAMHMQLISVPLQMRYRFDTKGRFKTYAFGGLGLNVIAQSDIDVKVDYNFPSLHEGEDPNKNPSLARTIRQTQRVSDDIREGAPFSTNSYISANLGLGIEYSLVERKTLFLQTAYQYQIPNLRFSNHNGKHVLSLSLQAGVRTPLGT